MFGAAVDFVTDKVGGLVESFADKAKGMLNSLVGSFFSSDNAKLSKVYFRAINNGRQADSIKVYSRTLNNGGSETINLGDIIYIDYNAEMMSFSNSVNTGSFELSSTSKPINDTNDNKTLMDTINGINEIELSNDYTNNNIHIRGRLRHFTCDNKIIVAYFQNSRKVYLANSFNRYTGDFSISVNSKKALGGALGYDILKVCIINLGLSTTTTFPVVDSEGMSVEAKDHSTYSKLTTKLGRYVDDEERANLYDILDELDMLYSSSIMDDLAPIVSNVTNIFKPAVNINNNINYTKNIDDLFDLKPLIKMDSRNSTGELIDQANSITSSKSILDASKNVMASLDSITDAVSGIKDKFNGKNYLSGQGEVSDTNALGGFMNFFCMVKLMTSDLANVFALATTFDPLEDAEMLLYLKEMTDGFNNPGYLFACIRDDGTFTNRFFDGEGGKMKIGNKEIDTMGFVIIELRTMSTLDEFIQRMRDEYEARRDRFTDGLNDPLKQIEALRKEIVANYLFYEKDIPIWDNEKQEKAELAKAERERLEEELGILTGKTVTESGDSQKGFIDTAIDFVGGLF